MYICITYRKKNVFPYHISKKFFPGITYSKIVLQVSYVEIFTFRYHILKMFQLGCQKIKGKCAIRLLSKNEREMRNWLVVKNWQMRNYLLFYANFQGDFMRNCDVVYGNLFCNCYLFILFFSKVIFLLVLFFI